MLIETLKRFPDAPAAGRSTAVVERLLVAHEGLAQPGVQLLDTKNKLMLVFLTRAQFSGSMFPNARLFVC